jgi:hypothetical protein
MEKAINEVKKQGYTVIPNFVDSTTITKLKELCDSLPPCRGAVSAGWTLIILHKYMIVIFLI